MMRILDDKNVIMGDSRQDNLLVLFRIEEDADDKQDSGLEEQAKAKPDRKMSQEQLLATASVLLDEGYSTSFDRCLKVATAVNGDIECARDMLSRITITEN